MFSIVYKNVMRATIIFVMLCCLGSIAHSIDINAVAPTVTLNNGRLMPMFGLGTWLGHNTSGKVAPNDTSVEYAVRDAIDTGYRHIDTAAIYDTELQVGRAIKNSIRAGVVKREHLFITTKLWNDKHARHLVVPALRQSLLRLNLTYVDLYLIHWPVSTFPNGTLDTIDYLETWAGMIDALDLGLTRSIGVSNFNQHMLDRIITQSHVVPAVLQVEVNLNLQQPQLRTFCKHYNIAVVGFTPFGSLFPSKASSNAPAPRIDDPDLIRIATNHNKTVPQIVLRYLLDLEVTPIPKSVTRERIQQNIQVFDFQLTEEEQQKLKSYDYDYRSLPAKHWTNSIYYPFAKINNAQLFIF